MDCRKYKAILYKHSTHSAGWDTWTNIKEEVFEGDDLTTVRGLARSADNSLYRDHRDYIQYYIQHIEPRPTVIATICNEWGETKEEEDLKNKEGRHKLMLELQEEFNVK